MKMSQYYSYGHFQVSRLRLRERHDVDEDEENTLFNPFQNELKFTSQPAELYKF